MASGDLTKALPVLTVVLDGRVVELERSASDVLAFELGAPHAGAHALNDQATLQLSDTTHTELILMTEMLRKQSV